MGEDNARGIIVFDAETHAEEEIESSSDSYMDTTPGRGGCSTIGQKAP